MNERAIRELEQMYMMLSEEKKKAIDEAIKALQAQADGDIITALCSLPKIQSEDGQDYVQLYDVLETVRRYLGDCISRTEAIKTIQQHGVGCFDADDFTPEQCERYVIKLLQNLKPSVAIPNKVGHWEYNQYDGNPNIGNWHCSECRNIVSDMPTCMGKPLYEFCPNCGCPMEIER